MTTKDFNELVLNDLLTGWDVEMFTYFGMQLSCIRISKSYTDKNGEHHFTAIGVHGTKLATISEMYNSVTELKQMIDVNKYQLL